MKARIAKKVSRNCRNNIGAYRWGTMAAAGNKLHDLWCRKKKPYTAGWRWGRWDPGEPQNPNEPPF